MKAGQRIILVAYSLLVIAIVVLFALLVCGSFGVDNTIKFIKEVSDNVLYLAAIITIAVSLVVISFCMMFLCVRGQESSTLPWSSG